jgi:CBS-domain-containing membrane protein
MARKLSDAGELTAAQVTHREFSTLPASATVADVREWFAASPHRMMAFLAADGRYAGSLTRSDVADGHDGARPATDVARRGPTVAPDAPAIRGHELALSSPALRVPVVDATGRLLGVVAVTADLSAFCGVG